MRIRPYTSADLAEIHVLHEKMGFDYRFPDLLGCTQVVEDEFAVRMAVGLKMQAEVYMWIDQDWRDPQQRWLALQLLQEAVREEAQKLGIDDVVAYIPPELAGRFAKRLKMLGWERDREGWEAWSRTTKESNAL